MLRLIFILAVLVPLNSFQQTNQENCGYYIPNTLTLDCCEFGCEYLNVETNCTFTKFEFTIYTNSGEIVFYTTSTENKFNWIGYSEGIYFWKLSAEFNDCSIVNDTGKLLILM
jgi:hypothetical protein